MIKNIVLKYEEIIKSFIDLAISGTPRARKALNDVFRMCEEWCE